MFPASALNCSDSLPKSGDKFSWPIRPHCLFFAYMLSLSICTGYAFPDIIARIAVICQAIFKEKVHSGPLTVKELFASFFARAERFETHLPAETGSAALVAEVVFYFSFQRGVVRPLKDLDCR